MTAEVVVLSRRGLAIAADSAVSVGEAKVYHGAQKIFAVGDGIPLGVMVFGLSEITRIPSDLFVPEMVRALREPRSHLDDYLDPLLEFFGSSELFRDEPSQQLALYSDAFGLFNFIVQSSKGENDLRAEFEKLGQRISGSESLAVMAELDRLPEWFAEVVEEAMRDAFEDAPVPTDDLVDDGLQLVREMWGRDAFLRGINIVLAGYGTQDFFPGVVWLEVDAVAGPCIRYAERDRAAISFENPAVIYPFAQIDTINGFVRGVAPSAESGTRDALWEILGEVEGLDADVARQVHERYCERQDEIERDLFVTPILDAVGTLPLGGLASMAETLVSLTSFRQRVSSTVESVGGEVRVATIDRASGFGWWTG